MKQILILFAIILVSCTSSVNVEKEKQQIKERIALTRQAHFERDAELFFQPNAESWVDIRNGQIKTVHKDERLTGTQSYLDQMDFLQLETLGEPVIEIADDGSLATYASSVLVKGLYGDSPVVWVFSWQNVLRKIDGEWFVISAANTEATDEVIASVVLDQVRASMGPIDTLASLSALAACEGPEGNSFTTLIYSRKTDGRMEQLSGNRHTVLKQGDSLNWGYNVNTQKRYESIDQGMQFFVKSHELHWLSIWPETRYAKGRFSEITTFNERQAIKIEFNDYENRPVQCYYDFETYQPLGFDIQISPEGDIVTTYFKDWTVQEGIKVFSKALIMEGEKPFKYDFSSIKFNHLTKSDFENADPIITD